jgi:hypothetical protein
MKEEQEKLKTNKIVQRTVFGLLQLAKEQQQQFLTIQNTGTSSVELQFKESKCKFFNLINFVRYSF